MITNKGMVDAENVEVVTKFDDSLGQIQSVFKIEKLEARVSQPISLTVKGISPEILDTQEGQCSMVEYYFQAIQLQKITIEWYSAFQINVHSAG